MIDRLAHCVQTATPDGSNLYYGLLFVPPAEKIRLLALFALQAELDAITDHYSDPGIAHLQLAWWREEIQNIFTGQAQHPVAQQLAATVTQWISAADLNALVDAAELLINPQQPDTLSAALQLCAGHRITWQLSARLACPQIAALPEQIAKLGELRRWLFILQQTRHYSQRQCCLLPSIPLQAAGIERDKLISSGYGSLLLILQDLLTHVQDELKTLHTTLWAIPSTAQLYAVITTSLCQCVAQLKPKQLLQSQTMILPLKKLLLAYWIRYQLAHR